MAVQTYTQATITGTTIATIAPNIGGDKVAAGSRNAVLVENGSGSAITITIDVPGNDKYGSARPDIAVAVAAGAKALIGPFPDDLIGSDGYVTITPSSVTSLTYYAISI